SPWSSSPAAGPPSTTSWPTAPTWSSTRRSADPPPPPPTTQTRRTPHGTHDRGRDRCRPGRAGGQPPADRQLGGPRGPRARPGRRALALPALGLPAPAEPQLAHPPAGLDLHRSRPEGHLAAREVADHLSAYALHSRAPVFTGTEVISVRRTEDGYAIHTSEGLWLSDAVVVATGWCDTAARPP